MKVIKQDVTKLTCGVIAHGCNCQGVMGGGVAKALRDKWPQIFRPYKDLCIAGDYSEEALGLCVIVKIYEHDALYVANCLTQHRYGNDGKAYADLRAIEQSMKHALSFAKATGLPFYTVKIGCLRGGLDWTNDVEPLFKQIQQEYPTVEIIVCDI